MAKGAASPILSAEGETSVERRASTSVSSPRNFFRQPSLRFLRRIDTIDDDDIVQSHRRNPKSTPLLTLKLSSLSFLSTTAHDGLSQGPLYSMETIGPSTTISRSDPWEGLVTTAEIKWPTRPPTRFKLNESDGILVHLSDGKWRTAADILKASHILR